MIVAAILGKRGCDSLICEAVLMCLYAKALLARVRFRANLMRVHEIDANYWKNRDWSVFGGPLSLPKRDLSPFFLLLIRADTRHLPAWHRSGLIFRRPGGILDPSSPDNGSTPDTNGGRLLCGSAFSFLAFAGLSLLSGCMVSEQIGRMPQRCDHPLRHGLQPHFAFRALGGPRRLCLLALQRDGTKRPQPSSPE